MLKIIETKLKTISTRGGRVRHIIKKSDDLFSGFGEAYFSCIEQDEIRGWKKHRQMTMNLIVPSGNVRFVFQVENTEGKLESQTFVIGESNYARLTVPPRTWFAFQGLNKGENIILNVSDIEHDPTEGESLALSYFDYNWEPN